MYHLDNTSGVPEMPEPKEQQSITPRWFGESQEQGGISWPGADWFNTVQAELLNLLSAAGITPDKRSYDQLSQAIPVLGGERIKNDLSSPDGFRMLGRCPHRDELKKTEPVTNDQAIILERAIENGPILNHILVCDSGDLASAENGYSIFVSAAGARWKADVSQGLDIRLAGLKSDGSNLGSCINKVILGEVQRAIAVGSSILSITRINIPLTLYMGEMYTEYALDEAVVIPSYFNLVFEGAVTLRYPELSGCALTVSNTLFYEKYGLTGWDVTERVHMQGAKSVRSLGGRVKLEGVGASTPNNLATGLFIGNTNTNSNVLNVRDLIVEDLDVSGFFIGYDTTVKNTYLTTLRNCSFTFNFHNIHNTIIDVVNGGEKLLLDNVNISNAIKHGIYWNCVGAGVTLSNCHIDYNGGSAICMGYGARHNQFILTNGTWVEAWGEWFIDTEASGGWGSKLYNSFVIDNAYILPRNSFLSADGTFENWSPRPIIRNRFVRDTYHFNNVFLDFKGTGAARWASLVEPGSLGTAVVSYGGWLRVKPKYLLDYRHTLNGGLFNFSGNQGTNIKNRADAGTHYILQMLNDTGPEFTMTYGAVDISDENSYTQIQPVVITSDSINARFHLYNKELLVTLTDIKEKLFGCLTIKPLTLNMATTAAVINLRLSVFKASDLINPIQIFFGEDTKLQDFHATNGDGSSSVTLICSAQLPPSFNGNVGGALVVVPSIHVAGALGSFEISAPAIWR